MMSNSIAIRILLGLTVAFFVTNTWAQELEPTACELRLMQGFPPPQDKFVDATNWTIYPFNRWGFKNVQRFQPTAFLYNGLDNSVPWQRDLQNLDQLKIKTPDKKTFEMRNLMEVYNTDALVVVHSGRLVYERYWNGMTPTTPHWLASTSKSVVGTAAAILVDRGVLDREKKIKDYIPELAKSGFGDATLDQLLDMTAGTAWDESMDELINPESFARQYGAAAGSWKIKGVESDGVFAFLPLIKQDREHGKSFVYNSPQVDVLGWILNRATGKSLERIVSDELWSHLGAEAPAYYMLDTAGFAWSTGGLSTTARDLARFGLLMLQEGQFNGQRIFPATVATDIQNNGDKKAFAIGSHADLYPGGAYRNYWWIKNDDDGAYLAKGIYGQYIYINPKKDVVIVRFASEKVSADRERMMRVEAALKEIATYLAKQSNAKLNQ
jgi:CubicO group peptidase (beta-lactamase class C family)